MKQNRSPIPFRRAIRERMVTAQLKLRRKVTEFDFKLVSPVLCVASCRWGEPHKGLSLLLFGSGLANELTQILGSAAFFGLDNFFRFSGTYHLAALIAGLGSDFD